MARVARRRGLLKGGGIWNIDPGGSLIISGARITTIGAGASVSLGNMQVMGPTAFESVRTVAGRLRVGSVFMAPDVRILGSGYVGTWGMEPRRRALVGGGATAPAPVVSQIRFDLDGGPFVNEGTVAPGDIGATDAFGLDGSYTQTDTGTLHLDIGAENYDQLQVTGAVTLDGTLEIGLLDGYVPQPEDVFVIIEAAAISGRFANAAERLYSDAGAFDVSYLGDSVTLTNFDAGAVPPTPTPVSTCPGDCGGNDQVTVDEILTLVSIALGNLAIDACVAGDVPPLDNRITVDEILAAVTHALSGCP